MKVGCFHFVRLLVVESDHEATRFPVFLVGTNALTAATSNREDNAACCALLSLFELTGARILGSEFRTTGKLPVTQLH